MDRDNQENFLRENTLKGPDDSQAGGLLLFSWVPHAVSDIVLLSDPGSHFSYDNQVVAQYRLLRAAALVHDIGKLAVALGILNKPGKLR